MDILSDILMRLNLKGSLYFRTSFTSPWGVQVPPFQNVARFHYAHVGTCLARVDGLDHAVTLQQGDLLIIPRGAGHRLYCDPATELDALPLDRVIELSGFAGEGALVYGGGAAASEAQLICGHFAFDPMARHPLLDRLPPYILLSGYGEGSGRWLEQTLAMIGTEAASGKMGGDMIALKMSEIIFAQALRAFVEREGNARDGLRGYADDQMQRALAALHRKPAAPWTVAELAQAAGMSRTAFAVRFSDLMAMTPMTYLASWRMQIARHTLRHTRQSVGEVAEGVGYASEAAFARVFKRDAGMTPAAFRKAA
ncbi:AraC family transcriptional regulator [Tabrizicola sp.]|uniref:AraC family transcriptional regulator n=1 Tax=Tabrizicola sp. TaxID=2005166 RepID=UPI00286C2C4A|nr:AraC family transcriptional regulator [Tabrizicola sp.]